MIFLCKEIRMAINKTFHKCGKEIRGGGHTVKGDSNTLLGSFQIFDRDLCDECFKDVQENTLKKN